MKIRDITSNAVKKIRSTAQGIKLRKKSQKTEPYKADTDEDADLTIYNPKDKKSHIANYTLLNQQNLPQTPAASNKETKFMTPATKKPVQTPKRPERPERTRSKKVE